MDVRGFGIDAAKFNSAPLSDRREMLVAAKGQTRKSAR